MRGLAVGAGVLALTIGFAPGVAALAHPLWALAFALAGSAILAILGLIAGIWADKFDQLAAFQNFVVLPLPFLPGVFYSTHSLPPLLAAGLARETVLLHDRQLPLRLLRALRRLSPWLSLAIVGAFLAALSALTLALLARGWRLRP